MKQLYVKLQTPVIELTVKAEDSSKTKDSMIVGFKRYPLEEADKELKKFQQLLEEQLDSMQEGTSDLEEVNNFIKSQIEYIKQAHVVIHDEAGKESELTVADTRKAKPNDGLWDDADSCLDALLDLYLSSTPYRSSLITALQKALLNMDYEEEQLKN